MTQDADTAPREERAAPAAEKPEKARKPEKSEGSEKAERAERIEKAEKPAQAKRRAARPPKRIAALMQHAAGRFGLTFQERIDLIVRILLMVVVAWGCYLVVSPFLTAILIAAVLAVVTWPIFERMRTSFGRSATPAAVLMVLLIIVGFLIPVSFILVVVAQQVPKAVSMVVAWVKDPMPVLDAVKDLPYVGSWLYEQLLAMIDPATFASTVQKIFDPVSSAVLNAALDVSSGVVQLALVTFIVFFFYRDGSWFADRIRELVERVSGGIASEITGILVNTTRSVVFGIIGTAIGQGIVAGIGFWIAGVPGVLLLSATVCLLSVIPVGPPLVWIPVAVWLYSKGETGMAVFMLIWGSCGISSVDNFLKPLLIARGSTLPLALIFLGVFGGVLAFGFLGLILGPLLLAIGVSLFQNWLKRPVAQLAASAVSAAEAEEAGPEHRLEPVERLEANEETGKAEAAKRTQQAEKPH